MECLFTLGIIIKSQDFNANTNNFCTKEHAQSKGLGHFNVARFFLAVRHVGMLKPIVVHSSLTMLQ